MLREQSEIFFFFFAAGKKYHVGVLQFGLVPRWASQVMCI